MTNYSSKNPKIPEGINASNENPLKEFFILLSGISFFIITAIIIISLTANQLAKHIPFSWELSAFSQWQMLPPLIDDTPATANNTAKADYLQQLMNDLSKHAELPNDMRITVHFIDKEVPNAFATMGGNIFIYQGLIDQLDSENALSMVMAHELAHIKYRHPIQALSKGVLAQFFMSVIFGGDNQLHTFIGNTGLLTLLHFNRQMEEQSDQEALRILNAHYGHTQGAETFFVKMLEEHNNPNWQEIFATHPDLNQRIEYILANRNRQKTALTKPLHPLLISTEQ